MTNVTNHQGIASWLKLDPVIGTLAAGTISGGAAAALTKGNIWQGAVTGLVVAGLNHLGEGHGDGEQQKPSQTKKHGTTDKAVFKMDALLTSNIQIDIDYNIGKNGGFEDVLISSKEYGYSIDGDYEQVGNFSYTISADGKILVFKGQGVIKNETALHRIIPGLSNYQYYNFTGNLTIGNNGELVSGKVYITYN